MILFRSMLLTKSLITQNNQLLHLSKLHLTMYSTTTTTAVLSSQTSIICPTDIDKQHNQDTMFIACNVYISAGGNSMYDQPILKKLLNRLQSVCYDISSSSSSKNNQQQHEQQLQQQQDKYPSFNEIFQIHNNNKNKNNSNSSNDQVVVVVHAYIDPVYDRSSFHLAGTPWGVAVAVTDLVSNTFQQFATTRTTTKATTIEQNNQSSSSTQHPTIGLVDHISILPLIPNESNNDLNDKSLSNKHSQLDSTSNNTINSSFSVTGKVAKLIGTELIKLYPSSFNVLWYGYAHPNGMSLAWVRKNESNFFQSGSSSKSKTNTTSTRSNSCTDNNINNIGSCTIGAPSYFVENYNIRLNGYTLSEARNLTKTIRQKFPLIVEGLTLPYATGATNIATGSSSNANNNYIDNNNNNKNNNDDVTINTSCYEVACNLLQPNIVSVHNVQSVVDEWYQNRRVTTSTSVTEATTTTSSTILQSNQLSNSSIKCSNFMTVSSQLQSQPPYGYRVGTTAKQCYDALLTCSKSEEDRRTYDSIVTRKMLGT
jgi:Formiminotransferase domain, N-terminal subdomain